MQNAAPRTRCRRAVASVALAGLLAFMALTGASLLGLDGVVVTPVQAQGGMDIGIVSPSFSDLPDSLQPGQAFTITAITAPGARCSGWLLFRNQPPISLDTQLAPGGACSWTVTVPPTTRPGTATIGVEVSRSGQQWALYGVTYVAAVGESR